jgi:glycosyltransferase involved in cell wall biosynthesis
MRGQRLVTTDHGLGGGGRLGLLSALFDRFLTVSRFSASVLGVPAHKTRVVYGGANPQRFAPDPEVGRDGGLSVGRLTPHKGIDRLIRALPDAARLTVAGTGGTTVVHPNGITRFCCGNSLAGRTSSSRGR